MRFLNVKSSAFLITKEGFYSETLFVILDRFFHY
jgi:hypothetical protein